MSVARDTPPIDVRPLNADEAHRAVSQLADILVDCVEGGASVSFLWPFSKAAAVDFFKNVAEGVAAGNRILLAAFVDSRLVGTVQILTAMPPNQPHRADVAKLLAHRSARGRGVGRRLMEETETNAHVAGKTLLVPDTVTGGDGEQTLLGHELGQGWRHPEVCALAGWALVRHNNFLEIPGRQNARSLTVAT